MIEKMGHRTPPPEPMSVSVTLLSQMFLYLASLHVNTNQFLRSIGVDPGTLQAPDARIPIETYLLIQDKAAEYTGDPYFGLHMGEFAQAGSWSILGYMMMNSKTVGQALEKAERYSRIVGDLIEIQREFQGNRIKYIYSASRDAPKMSRHCFEASLASSVRLIRTITGIKLSPLVVHFTFSLPANLAEYERVFSCPVCFEQAENSLTIDADILDTPILLPNAELLQHFENYANEFLAKIDQKKEYTHKVTKLILTRLDDEKLSINGIAREMNVSVRTLQNRLREEGAIFSKLLQEIRIKLAKKYLHEEHSIETIAYLLGFSEPSVFRKAFKKWSGVTPKEYREQSVSIANRV